MDAIEFVIVESQTNVPRSEAVTVVGKTRFGDFGIVGLTFLIIIGFSNAR